jgi:hypothetical protein
MTVISSAQQRQIVNLPGHLRGEQAPTIGGLWRACDGVLPNTSQRLSAFSGNGFRVTGATTALRSARSAMRSNTRW